MCKVWIMWVHFFNTLLHNDSYEKPLHGKRSNFHYFTVQIEAGL